MIRDFALVEAKVVFKVTHAQFPVGQQGEDLVTDFMGDGFQQVKNRAWDKFHLMVFRCSHAPKYMLLRVPEIQGPDLPQQAFAILMQPLFPIQVSLLKANLFAKTPSSIRGKTLTLLANQLKPAARRMKCWML
ncbi:hypothetical protein GCM10008938_36420 [Deinococcus roseus]|uniref:Transposase IS200-like domain-containing protein n=1 Tax=Deinococcus roseus TaxID=392414 RepID=A0ABQ2D6E3_9DEIO|nr:hypothetical protein GCM10008938_36420 [Deinococcus roseus]